MKSLKTLLKVAERNLETLRIALAEKSAEQAALEDKLRALQQTILAEQETARGDYEAGRLYAAYAQAAGMKQQAMAADVSAATRACDQIRELIAEAHVEARKFERLIELNDEREKAAAEKREAAELDEMATQRAGRARA